MKLFDRLFNRGPKKSTTVSCPRCLGKGHVDKEDINRLRQQGKWNTGSCAYCKGAGIVDQDMLSKVPADATYLTTSISDEEREIFINKTQLEGCPVTEHNRLWLENAFLLLFDVFGKENTKQRRILKPHRTDFSAVYNGTEESAYEMMKIVAVQMEVPFESITLLYYDDRVAKISTGSPMGDQLYLGTQEEGKDSAGIYLGRSEDGSYQLGINRGSLINQESLIATLSHIIAYMKLLGENDIRQNSGPLAELTCILFGLGIFNANDAFSSFKNFKSYGWQRRGFLSQKQWGYALALFSYIRGEESPEWINYLTPNVKGDFLRSQQFIFDNPELIFQTNLGEEG